MAENTEIPIFFKRLRILIDTIGWSQKKLATKMNIDPNTITRWKNPDTPPSDGSILKICKATGVSYDWLMNGDGKMFRERVELLFEQPFNSGKMGNVKNSTIAQNGSTAKTMSASVGMELSPEEQTLINILRRVDPNKTRLYQLIGELAKEISE